MDPLASPLSPPRKFRAACTGLILFGLTASPSIAGPNAGGTLVLHAEPDIEFSLGLDYCGASTATGCAAWPCQDDQGRPLPSGLYWGRLHGPDGSSTRKIVIVR